MFVEAWLSWQIDRSFCTSTDPQLAKKRAIEDAYATLKDPASPHRVVCFDEHGLLQPIPHRGCSWQPRGRPRCQRSTSVPALDLPP
jgi:hypothetical protein